MATTGQELLEKYKKRRAEIALSGLGNVSANATDSSSTGSRLLEEWNQRNNLKNYKISIQDANSLLENDDGYQNAVDSYVNANADDDPYNAYFTNIDAGKASQGWEQYLVDADAAKNSPRYDINSNGKDDWWEYVVGWLKGTDRANEAMNPNDSWTDEQRNAFGQLYADSVDNAREFAKETNKRNNAAKEAAEVKRIQEAATSNWGSGIAHTLGAIATSPLQVVDYLDDLVQVIRGEEVTDDGSLSLGEYSKAVMGGISDRLNQVGGTVDESVPLVGGMGAGDLYEWGVKATSAAGAGALLGSAASAVSHFGYGATSAMEDALAKGVDQETAAIYGMAVGAIEGLMETYGAESIYAPSITSAFTTEQLIKNIVRRIGAEGYEEAVTKVATEIIELLMLQDESDFVRSMSTIKGE